MIGKLHTGAFIFFAVAMFFYALSWMPGALGMAVFGILFEAIAWITVLMNLEPRNDGNER